MLLLGCLCCGVRVVVSRERYVEESPEDELPEEESLDLDSLSLSF